MIEKNVKLQGLLWVSIDTDQASVATHRLSGHLFRPFKSASD